MTRFNLDAVVAEEARERFEFEAGGRVFSMPHVMDLTMGQRYALDSGQHIPVFRDGAQFAESDPGYKPRERKMSAGDLLASMLLEKTAAQLAPLVASWLMHAGHLPGESEASSTS